MNAIDILRFARQAAIASPLRTLLMLLAMSIGVAAVVMLTALGEGARAYVVGEFNALGSNLIIILPGRSETRGLSPGNFVTETPRDLTVEDATALRRVAGVERVAPLVLGTAEISFGGRLRDGLMVGTTAAFIELRRLQMAEGRFLPAEAEDAQVAVIGHTLAAELFGNTPPLGQWLRVGDRRFRVIGVLALQGQGLGMNTDELAIVPVNQALALFNTESLMRVLVETRSREVLEATRERLGEALKARHDGEEDVTLITQDAVVGTFDRILVVLTLGVAGIAAISLAVAGILVMNVMLVAVTQRTAEIGLMKALGGSGRTIRRVFLTEAALLSVSGAVVGVLIGHVGAWGVRLAFPDLPAWPPYWAVFAGLVTALMTGLIFGMLPARRAANLDPVVALGRK